MNTKEFKTRLLRGMIRPEYFYIPVGGRVQPTYQLTIFINRLLDDLVTPVPLWAYREESGNAKVMFYLYHYYKIGDLQNLTFTNCRKSYEYSYDDGSNYCYEYYGIEMTGGVPEITGFPSAQNQNEYWYITPAYLDGFLSVSTSGYSFTIGSDGRGYISGNVLPVNWDITWTYKKIHYICLIPAFITNPLYYDKYADTSIGINVTTGYNRTQDEYQDYNVQAIKVYDGGVYKGYFLTSELNYSTWRHSVTDETAMTEYGYIHAKWDYAKYATVSSAELYYKTYNNTFPNNHEANAWIYIDANNIPTDDSSAPNGGWAWGRTDTFTSYDITSVSTTRTTQWVIDENGNGFYASVYWLTDTGTYNDSTTYHIDNTDKTPMYPDKTLVANGDYTRIDTGDFDNNRVYPLCYYYQGTIGLFDGAKELYSDVYAELGMSVPTQWTVYQQGNMEIHSEYIESSTLDNVGRKLAYLSGITEQELLGYVSLLYNSQYGTQLVAITQTEFDNNPHKYNDLS